MKVTKQGFTRTADFAPGELEALNAFAKTSLSADEVYIFSVLLCDNEIDRDFERFSEDTLMELKELFVGATGICDHDWRSENQVARVYRTEILTDPNRKTSLGTPYTYLKAWAYMLRSEANSELIAEIEGGIKRETSVGCAVGESLCSVCGEEIGSCNHIKGTVYNGKLCYAELKGAVDAYEWSFVAVPAQKNAGVLKKFEGGEKEFEALRKKAELGEKYMAELKSEVLRLCLLCDEGMHPALKCGVSAMDAEALSSLKSAFEKQLENKFPPISQLRGKDEVTAFCGDEYLI